jgi:hypothetical protein
MQHAAPGRERRKEQHAMDGMDTRITNETTSDIDQVALAAAGGASRRTVLRGLAATLLATAGGGLAANAQAKKKRGKKGRKHKQKPHKWQPQPPTPSPSPKTCTPGEFICRVSVLADGSTVNTPVLLKDVDYVLRPSGFWGTSNDLLQDAFAAFTFADPQSPRLFIDGVRTGLLMNGELPDIWGQYKPNHSYGLVVIGKGQPVEFRMLDSDYTGNSGVVHVDITCAVQRQK